VLVHCDPLAVRPLERRPRYPSGRWPCSDLTRQNAWLFSAHFPYIDVRNETFPPTADRSDYEVSSVMVTGAGAAIPAPCHRLTHDQEEHTGAPNDPARYHETRRGVRSTRPISTSPKISDLPHRQHRPRTDAVPASQWGAVARRDFVELENADWNASTQLDFGLVGP
jgi:hypothetical protein